MGLLFPPFISGRGAVGLLLVRLVMGAAFILHGLPKIQNPMNWMDGMPGAAPPPLQAAAAVAEFGGGIALILGALTPLFALLLAGTMAFAVKFHLDQGHAFVAMGPSYELPAIYLAVALLLLLAGPGTMSLDAFLFRKKVED
jgi:putative oxidoreductase